MPVKHPSPLLGYNNNVRHKGKVFHVQTEDSGVKYGHIITHLFMDGGRILKSVKTSYSEYIDNDRMGEIVREMMKQQHKAMFIALRDGKFDPIIEGADVSQSTQAFPAAAPVAPATALSPAPAGVSAPVPAKAVPAAAPSKPALTPSPSAAARAAPFAVAATVPAPPVVEDEAPRTLRQASEELTLDIDAVERAAAAASAASPALRGPADLPPPPANLFREKVSAGKYRVTAPSVTPRSPGPGPAAGRPPSSSPMPSAAVARAVGSAGGAERRYAPTRPASIFGQARPQQGKSIFGEDLISDKSLDEVILSYLAEDLEGEKK
jgi:hypothetical protein